MSDDDVRALVREAIQRHLGKPTSLAKSSASFVEPSSAGAALTPQPVLLSFSRYKVERIGDDGMCLIEPAVRCNHCGYCECHGH
ncbi:MAG: hypothetical protein ACRD2N_00175 [Vicinamibacterales bacterium]